LSKAANFAIKTFSAVIITFAESKILYTHSVCSVSIFLYLFCYRYFRSTSLLHISKLIIRIKHGICIPFCDISSFETTRLRNELIIAKRTDLFYLCTSILSYRNIKKTPYKGVFNQTYHLLPSGTYSFSSATLMYPGLIIFPLFDSSSIRCADQPTILDIAKSGVNSSTGSPSIE